MDLTRLSRKQRAALREKLLEHFPELREQTTLLEYGPEGRKMFEEGLDEILEMFANGDRAFYYDVRRLLRPHELVPIPKAYQETVGHLEFADNYWAHCDEELREGLPVGVYEFDEMKGYHYHRHTTVGPYCQAPVGLYPLCEPDLPLPEELDSEAMSHRYRLVIDDEEGIVLQIREDEQAVIAPMHAGLYLVAPGVVQLTVTTVVAEEGDKRYKEIMEGRTDVPGLAAASERGSYFLHASLIKTEHGTWEVVPGMTEEAMLRNRDVVQHMDEGLLPGNRNAPFIEELFAPYRNILTNSPER